MDLWLLYGLVLFISYLTALLWRKWNASSKANDAAAGSQGTKSSIEQEKPGSDVGEEKDKETLTAASPEVDEEDKNSETSNISPEKLESSGKADELSIVSGKNLGDDRIDESENTERDIVISSKSVNTEVAAAICKESLNTSLEENSDEVVPHPEDSPNPENSLLFVESVKAQREDLISGPTDEVQNKTECDLTLTELRTDGRVSEESLSLQEKPESFGASALSTDVQLEPEVISKKSQRRILNAESFGLSVEEATLETPLKESEENKVTEDGVQTVLRDELAKEKSVGGSADKVEEKEAEGSGTAEAEAASEFHSEADDRQVASVEVSDTSQVIEPFSENLGEEDRSVIQESTRTLLTELENSQGGHFPGLEPCGDSLKTAKQKELSLEECSKVIDDLSYESSKPDEELSHIKLEQRELGFVENLLLSTHIEDEQTDCYPVEKEYEQLSQERLVQEVETKGKLLQKEPAEEKSEQREQLQSEELVGENKTAGDILISHEEALQESPDLEFAKAAEEEALLADALRTLESKNSVEEIVEAPSDQNDLLQKSVGLLGKAFGDTEPDVGSYFDSESIKATETVFDTSEWERLDLDKPDASLDQALEILSQAPLTSSARADVDGDQNKAEAEGLLDSDFSSFESVSQLKVEQDAELASSSPEEFSPALGLKQSNTTSSENKETPFEVLSLVDVEEKLTPVESRIETGQQLNLEGFSDTVGNPGIISDTDKELGIISDTGSSSDVTSDTGKSFDIVSNTGGNSSDIISDTGKSFDIVSNTGGSSSDIISDAGGYNSNISDTDGERSDIISYAGNSSDVISDSDGTLDRSFIVLGSAAVDISHSSSKLTDSAAEANSFEVGKLDTAFTTESPIIDSETDNPTASNLLQDADKELQTSDRGTPYSSFNRQSEEIAYTQPIIVASENAEGERGVELQENTVHQGEDVVEEPEISTEITSRKSTPVFSSGADVVNVTSALKLEEGKDISRFEDNRERENIYEVPAKESIQEIILTSESRDIPDILAEESGQEIREVLGEEIGEEVLQEKRSQGLQQVPDILAEVDRVPETSLEKSSQELQQVPDIFAGESRQEHQTFLEISTEKDSEELQQVPEILAEETNQEYQAVHEISSEKDSKELTEFCEKLAEEICQALQNYTVETSLEQSSEELHQVPVVSAEGVGPELYRGPETLGEEIIQEPLKVLGLLTEKDSQEVDSVSEFSGKEINQEPHDVIEISLEESNKELHQVPKILAEEISEELHHVPEVSLERSSQDLCQGLEKFDEEITREHRNTSEILVEKDIQGLHRRSDIVGKEIVEEPQKVGETSFGENREGVDRIPETLGEEISQVPQKFPDISLVENIQELHSVPDSFGEEISREPQKVLEISQGENCPELEQVSDIVGKEIIQESPQILDISLEERSEERHQVPEVLGEEIIQEPSKILDISLEERSEESHQVPEVLSEESIQESPQILDISLEERSEERHQVPEVLSEEIIQEPSKILDISLEERSEESHQVPEILGEEIIQEPLKILDISLEERSEERHQVPEILSEEIIQESPQILDISLEKENSEESHQVPEILGEEIVQVSVDDPNILLEKSSEEELHQVPQVFTEEISYLSQKFPESSVEKISLKVDEVSEILNEEISQEPAAVTEILAEKDIQELHQVPDIEDKEINQKPQKVLEISIEEDSEDQVPETFGEEISQVSQKIAEVSAEKDNQELDEVLGLLGEAIGQEPQNNLKTSLEKSSQELQQDPDSSGEQSSPAAQKVQDSSEERNNQELHQVQEILGEEISQLPQKDQDGPLEEYSQGLHVPEVLENISEEPQKVAEISSGESREEIHQVAELLSEEISQESVKVVEISSEKDSREAHQEPEILDVEISQEPHTVVDISVEHSCQELSQDSSVLGDAIAPISQKVQENLLEENVQEFHQVSDILGEEVIQKPVEVVAIAAAKDSLEKEIGQDPQKVVDILIEQSSNEVPEILDKEVDQESEKVLDIPLDQSSEELHQVTRILSEEISQDHHQGPEISLEKSSEELYQVPDILGEEITREPVEVPEVSAEKEIQELHKVSDIFGGEIVQEPRIILQISSGESSENFHQIPEILTEEISKERSQVPEISLGTSSPEHYQIPEVLGEELTQEPLKVSAEKEDQELHKAFDILGEESVEEPQKVLQISSGESSENLHQIPEILGEEIGQKHQIFLEIAPEKSDQETQKLQEISEEEINQIPQNDPEISLEKCREELPQDREILSEKIDLVDRKVPDNSLEERSQEVEQGLGIFGEDISQVPVKDLDISAEKKSEEVHQNQEILGGEISRKPHKVVDNSSGQSSEELHQVPTVFAEEISKELHQVPEISSEESSQELYQVSKTLCEGIIREALKIQEILPEEDIQGVHQVSDIVGEDIIQEPENISKISFGESSEEILGEENSPVSQEFYEVLVEKSSEELQEQPLEVLDEKISKEPREVAESLAEKDSQELHHFKEILSGEAGQEPLEVPEILVKENGQELSRIPETLGEEISQLSQKVSESSPEGNNQDLHQVTENLDREIGQEPREDLDGSLGEDGQELHQIPDSLDDEIDQPPQKVQESSLEGTGQEIDQVPENSSEKSSQEAAEVAEILAGEDNKEPETDKVFSPDTSKLLVHQLEMTAQSQIRFLVLNLNENNESQVFRLEKGFTLQFFLGPTLANTTVRLFVDHPLPGEAWDKNSYRELEWSHLPALQLDVCEGHADVVMTQAGSFRYYFTIDGSDCKDRANGCGFFLVDPDLVIGKSQKKLPLDGIICQTVMSKLLGPFPEWDGRLRVAKETGYNVIHFTPLQELGASNSAYALKDQMKLNPVFQTSDRTFDFDDVQRLVETLNDEHELLSFTDLVPNHTANESPWIFEHPECVFNLVNSPHLKPAYLLDRCLRMFSANVADGLWEHEGVPPALNSEEHLEHIATVLHASVLPELRLSEFYQVSVDDVLNSFRSLIIDGSTGDDNDDSELRIIPDPEYRRLQSTVNLSVAVRLFYSSQSSDVASDEKIRLAVDALRVELERLNAQADVATSAHLSAAVRNFVANARYRFVDANGLRLTSVTREQPIMNRYFVNSHGYLSMEDEEKLIHSEKAAFCMAHNGWIHNITDPLVNFAESGSNVYLRRELNSWEDSVKLRYGDTPADCPYLWDLMRKYVIETARIFHGVRLDNCHNTPIHVLEWMLAECRAVRPDLYVMAELFTPSTHFDNIFINRLGLNAMIREALGAGDPRDLGNRLVGCSSTPVGAFFQLPLRPLTSSLIHDLIFDQTHDNPSIVDQRTVLDVLPNAALVAMVKCAIASTRGYDEVVPHHVSVTSEYRLFRSWSADDLYDGSKCVGIKTGIIAAKRALNKLHWQLTTEGYNQISVEHLTDDVVAVTRHNPVTHESIVLVAHTAFRPLNLESSTTFVPSLPVQGRLSEVILEAQVVTDATKTFVPNEKYICGLDGLQLIVRENIDINESEMVRVESRDNSQIVEFVQFPTSSVIVFRVSLDDSTNISLAHLRHLLACFGYKMRPPGGGANDVVSTADGAELEEIFTELTLSDLNLVLYRCDAEERDDGYGYGVYHVPGFGDLPFCGLAGVMSVLVAIRASNNLDHPLCRNLKEGNWMLDYLSSRLLCHHGTKRLGRWLETQFSHIKNLPRSLVPCYFDAFATGVFVALEELAWNKMSDFVMKGSAFVRALALASIQLCGVSRSGSLPGLSPHLDPPIQAMIVGAEGLPQMNCVTIAAGLPHFSSGSFRCWGRDTFVSIRGLLLVMGRFDEARFLILAFAGYLRHGLIPNFLGCGGLGPRYNSRDAVWWWMQAIQDYCNMAPHGIAILNDKVSRCYPTDDSSLLPPGACDQSLCDVIQEALQKHASGVKFRERDAGPTIDNDMTSAGFDVEFGVDWTTGFVFGGNEHNCGTWMDKMGSSQGALNLGKPATPRHGSAVEIVGLCYSTVKWLDDVSQRGLFPYAGVSVLQDDVETQVTFRSWCDLITENFEPKFWIDNDPGRDPHPELVNRRGIYRDVYQCSHTWSEYQLRPNFTIAVALAPDLFNMDHAWAAVEQAGEVLMGPLGLKTLDPGDWEYSGFYDNSHWSMDFKTACGFSYHQGPEWIWLVGFFLRAMMQVAKRLDGRHDGILRDTLSNVRRILSTHHTFVHVSDWKSLPELTNENGEFCAASCPSQAWSIACILDSLYDAEKILETTPIINNDQ